METIWDWIGNNWRQLTVLTNLVGIALAISIQLISPANIRGALIRRYRASKAWWDGRGVRRENRKAEKLEKAKAKRISNCERDHDNLPSMVGKNACLECGYEMACNCPRIHPTTWNTMGGRVLGAFKRLVRNDYRQVFTHSYQEPFMIQHTCGKAVVGYWGTCMLCGTNSRFINEISLTAWEDFQYYVFSPLGIAGVLHVCVDTDECARLFSDRYDTPNKRLPSDVAERAKAEIEERQMAMLKYWMDGEYSIHRVTLCRILKHPEGHESLPHECRFDVNGGKGICCCGNNPPPLPDSATAGVHG